MPDEHARLSPSASERWLSCPASVRLVAELDVDDKGSIYAQEGTLAHALAEIEGSREFRKIDDKTYIKRHRAWVKEATAFGLTTEQRDAMAAHVDDLLHLIHDRLEEHPHSVVFFEQRMDTGVPTCWGTSDVVIVSPEHVEIIDLKYGQGVAVDAKDNPQLRLYALGALDTFGDLLGETEAVRVTIFQPRVNSTSAEEMTADDLRAWRRRVIPIAQEALDGSDRFGPSEAACRWCPLAGQCRPQMEWATAQDFDSDPDVLTPEEIGEILGSLGAIKKWCEQVEARALDLAYSESKPIPGYKVVMSGSQRQIVDPEGAVARLVELGFSRDDLVTTKIKGFGDIDALLKSLPKIKPEGAKRERYQKADDVLGDLVGKTTGKPSLVSEDDTRPAISPATEAAKDFS